MTAFDLEAYSFAIKANYMCKLLQTFLVNIKHIWEVIMMVVWNIKTDNIPH